MRIAISGLVCLLFCLGQSSTVFAQNFLFKHPRGGGFKVKKHDELDFTNAQHFVGSGVLAVGLYKVAKNSNFKHPKVVAGVMATVVGLLKELEDGYREGWGMKDVIFNEIGIVGALVTSSAMHYTVTIKHVVMGPYDYGIGIRFFRTTDFTSLMASLGIYVIRDNHQRSWVGMDTHFLLTKSAELHFGVSMIDLDDANRFHFRPNLGIGFRLY